MTNFFFKNSGRIYDQNKVRVFETGLEIPTPLNLETKN